MAKAKKQKKRNAKVRAARKRSRRTAQSNARRHASCNGNGALCRLPLEECRLNGNWRETGIAFVYLNRLAKYGELEGAGYLIDVWGIGIKDCFRTQDVWASEVEASSNFAEVFEGSMQECSEDLARQLVWGGSWRAREMGFRPPPEFGSCKKLLAALPHDEIDQSLFGKDGKPFIIGDFEDLQRRSTRPLDLESDEFEYILGIDELEALDLGADDEDPWDELFEEDDDPLIGPGQERTLFITGMLYGQSFSAFFEALSQWEDLHVEELDIEDETARLAWTPKYPDKHSQYRLFGGRRRLGEIEIDQSCLTISVRGKSWMLLMMDLLFEEFGESLVRGPLEIVDPMDLVESQSA